MATEDVIGDVSSVLRQVLTEAMSDIRPLPAPVADMHDLRGEIPTSPPLLTLFLYEVCEDPSLRNRGRVRELTATGVRQFKPPMALVLRYLVTAWGGDRVTEQRMLGRVLHALYDDSILSGPVLTGSLAGLDEALHVTLVPLTLEERTRVWWAVQKPYRLSLNYEIRIAHLDSESFTEATAVTRREFTPSLPGPRS